MEQLEKLRKLTIGKYTKRKRRRGMEKNLIPCLYHASSAASFKNTVKVIEDISKGYGELSNEFKKVKKEIDTGSSVKRALNNMKERTDSKLIRRAVKVMIISNETGSDLSKALEEIAEEISKEYKIKRKMKVSTTIEKYTLLLAGGIIVPVILGSLISVISSIDITSISTLGIGASEEAKEIIKSNSIKGNQIYIGFYSIIASLFVAYTEKEIEKSLIYITILLPLSIILFNLSRSINILQLL